MTKQAHSVLRKLRKAQITENGEVFINFTDMTACTCHAENEPCVTVDLSDYRDSLDSILGYLTEQGYLRKLYTDYYSVRHPGFHVAQTRWSAFCSFLVQSIVTPIIVTILTTLALRLLD